MRCTGHPSTLTGRKTKFQPSSSPAAHGAHNEPNTGMLGAKEAAGLTPACAVAGPHHRQPHALPGQVTGPGGASPGLPGTPLQRQGTSLVMQAGTPCLPGQQSSHCLHHLGGEMGRRGLDLAGDCTARQRHAASWLALLHLVQFFCIMQGCCMIPRQSRQQ
jgi:hypothetical protein